MTTTDLSDTSTWLPLDGLAPGFDANKDEPTTAMAGREIALTGADGGRTLLRFTAERVAFRHVAGPGAASEGEDPYEAIEVDEELYYVQFQRSDRPREAVSSFLDTRHGRALTVTSTVGTAASGRTAVGQTFVTATIDGATPSGIEPAPTTALLGRRVMWVYSSEHAYEHVYLSPHWYTWQCLAGPERGLADTDENTTYELRRGIYVFAWREKVIPCGSVTVADHRDLSALRSHGCLFGLDESGTRPVHFTFGAHGTLLSTTAHPAGYSPARA